jgi:adenine-specific DNA-methyltransferase
VQPDLAIADLIERVRRSGAEDAESVKAALRIELDRVLLDHATDPAGYAAWADGRDVIGTAYERLLSGSVRRPAGQFQTPFWAANVMAGWLLQEPAELLLDPGVGAGRLLFRAMKRRGRKPTKLLGLDVDPVALAMARANLTLRGIRNFELRPANFLLDELDEQPSAITCNPPFSRLRDVPAAERERIHAGFENRLGQRFSRNAGLHALFLVRAIEVAACDARIAFITPAGWLDTNYGRNIKRFVLEHAHVEAVLLLDDEHLLFDGALTTAAITLLRKGERQGEPTKMLRLDHRLPEPRQVLEALAAERTAALKLVRLDAERKWSRHPRRAVRGTPLHELARVTRGVATGDNGFFVLSERARKHWGITRRALRPCITTPRLIDGLELTRADLENLDQEVPRWLLHCHDPAAEQADTPLGAYLRHGKRYGAHTGYLASTREPWYSLERRDTSPILFTYLNKERPRFIRNLAGAIPLNTFLIVQPTAGVDPDELCSTLNSRRFLSQLRDARRSYGAGLWKLEPKELAELKLPATG